MKGFIERKHNPVKRYFVDPETIPYKPDRDRTPLDVGDWKTSSNVSKSGSYTKAQFFGFYKRYLGSDYWSELRSEILTPDILCGDCNHRKAIQLHHRYYSKFGRTVLFRERENIECLLPLCIRCHEKRHPHMMPDRRSP